jgi:membrane fusion protein (multidrug efflux system)
MNALNDKPAAVETLTQSKQANLAPKRSPKWLIKPVAAVAVIIGGVLVAHWWFTEGTYIESTDNAYVQGDIAVLSPRIDADVISVNVADNQAVKAGQKLISFDPRDKQALLDTARGSEAEAAAAIEVASRAVDQQRAAIAQSEAMIANAQAEQTRATVEAGRSGALTSAGWTSRSANDQAVADRRKADAMVSSTIAARDTARQALTVAQAQLTQAQAKLVTAQAQVRTAENNLSYTTLVAPFDGVVGNRAAQVGQHVLAGQQLIALAPPTSSLYVIANFKETQLSHMHRGQAVLLTPDIDTSAPVHAHIDSIAPASGALFSLLPPENATGNFTKVVQRFPVRISIDPDEASRAQWLRAGLSVTAEVDTRQGKHEIRGIVGSALHTLGLN